MSRRQSGAIRKKPTGTELLERLLSEAKPSFHAWHVTEPALIFANRRTCEDPKTGITLFGPAGLDRTPRPTIRVGVVGTGDSIQMLANWIESARSPFAPAAMLRANYTTRFSRRPFPDSMLIRRFGAAWKSLNHTPKLFRSQPLAKR